MTDYTLLPDQSLFAVHDVRDITGKEALTADYYYYWQAIGEVTKKSNMLVFLLWGVLDVISVVLHYDTLRWMKWSTVAHWLVPSLPITLRLPSRAVIGWYCVVWTRHKEQPCLHHTKDFKFKCSAKLTAYNAFLCSARIQRQPAALSHLHTRTLLTHLRSCFGLFINTNNATDCKICKIWLSVIF